MAENSLQSRVLKYLNSLPNCVAENVSGNSNQSGRADINGCISGRAFKIELKDPKTGYEPSKKQLRYLEKWSKKAGALAAVCYSLNDVKELLEEYL